MVISRPFSRRFSNLANGSIFALALLARGAKLPFRLSPLAGAASAEKSPAFPVGLSDRADAFFLSVFFTARSEGAALEDGAPVVCARAVPLRRLAATETATSNPLCLV